MAELTSARRKQLAKGSFALPEERAYPIHDEAHARNALSRVKQHGTPSEQRRVVAAVSRRYPGIEVETKPSKAAEGAVVLTSTPTGAPAGFFDRDPSEVLKEAMK